MPVFLGLERDEADLPPDRTDLGAQDGQDATASATATVVVAAATILVVVVSDDLVVREGVVAAELVLADGVVALAQ